MLLLRILVVLNVLLFFTNAVTRTFAQPSPSIFGVFDIAPDDRTWPALNDLNVGWVREQFRLGENKEELGLSFYRTIFEEGYGLFLTIYHRDSTNIENLESFRNSTRGSYPPKDSLTYKALVSNFVSALVSELTLLQKNPDDYLIIQFCNEVVPIDIVTDSPTRFWHGTSDEYLQTLHLTYDAVKSISGTNIPIANAGISSATLEIILDIEQGSETATELEQQIYAFNDRILREGVYDWADIHLRHAKETIPNKVRWVKERWTGPLAATEFAGPDERSGIIFTEELQATELVERMDLAQNHGVDRIFWSHLIENPSVDEIYFKEGLIELDTWRRKPAFYAYSDYIKQMSVSNEEELESIIRTELFQNYPNPFNPQTTISFYLDRPSIVEVKVFDFLGRKVDDINTSFLPIGYHQFMFNGDHLPSGMYFYELTANQFRVSKPMILLK